jgi:hypothetical protein
MAERLVASALSRQFCWPGSEPSVWAVHHAVPRNLHYLYAIVGGDARAPRRDDNDDGKWWYCSGFRVDDTCETILN